MGGPADRALLPLPGPGRVAIRAETVALPLVGRSDAGLAQQGLLLGLALGHKGGLQDALHQRLGEQLKIPFDHSLPHHPQNNSLAKRNNQFISTTTTTCLLEAGLPPCFWNHAVECVSHWLNVKCGEDGKSPWLKLNGKKEFDGEKVPFGAKLSSQGRVLQKHKFDPKAILGVPGLAWSLEEPARASASRPESLSPVLPPQ